MPDADPITSATRRNRSERRIGQGRACKCGEDRPLALIPRSDPLICAECRRIQKGQSRYDRHHVAGRANHPLTVPIPANDHRAVLSEAQYNWPERTLKNPNGSPLLVIAACIRGFIEALRNMLDRLLGWIPEFLERLDVVLTDHFGDWWWTKLGIEWEPPYACR